MKGGKLEIIAEIGQNFNGDIGLAREMVHSIAENGGDVAKFQLYDARSLYKPENNPWYEYSLKAEVKRRDLPVIFEECQRAGVEFMASVFDSERLEWLEELGVKRYKIASRSIHDAPLLEALEKTGKPLIISLGFWDKPNFPHIETKGGVSFLYCIPHYPTNLSELKFSAVDFSKYHGFSDHTLGVTAAMAAFARGAAIVEKHFTFDKKIHGPDHSCSMTPSELKQIDSFRREVAECL